MSTARNLTFGEVEEGQELPPLEYPVTATTVVLGAIASRDWRPMHHDRDFAIPVFPGDTMTLSGRVARKSVDPAGCCWIHLDLAVSVGDKVNTECQARFALPADADDNPWQRHGDRWQP